MVSPGQSANWRRPAVVYATAWYDRERNGLDPIRRIAFNGRPLEQLSNRSGPSYALKQTVTGAYYEEWINWYAFFDFPFFPNYVSADAVFSQPRSNLRPTGSLFPTRSGLELPSGVSRWPRLSRWIKRPNTARLGYIPAAPLRATPL